MRSYIVIIIYITSLMLLMLLPFGSVGIERVELVGFRGDHIVHFALFLPWMFLLSRIMNSAVSFVLWMILGFILACSLEFTQTFVPGRGSNLVDALAGCVGVLISSIMALGLRLYRR